MNVFSALKAPFCLLLLMLYGGLMAQDTAVYLVQFEEKVAPSSFDPMSYLSPEAIERRARLGLAAWDWYDLPVNPKKVQSVQETGASIRHQLRWFNGVSVSATTTQLAEIEQIVGLESIRRLSVSLPALAEKAMAVPPEGFDTLLYEQRKQLALDTLSQAGLSGKGVRIAIFDAGFKGVDVHPAFAHVRERDGIIATYDFYGGDDNVYHHDRHGTAVMGCISGKYEEKYLGAAPEADFLLARVEHALREPAVEEDHWMAAAEWADRMGADLINSSLGYTKKRYTYEDMDGETAPVSIAARIATKKGMLVVNSAGNEGDVKWRYLGAPADVPEVLTVGGSLPMLPERIRFSSFGPNAAGVLKPDVAAPGFVLSTRKKGRYTEHAGTSFSAPLVTGIAACYLQLYPNTGPEALATAIRRSGHFYPYFDYGLGYGIVDSRKLLGATPKADTSFQVIYRSDSVILAFNEALMADSADFPFGRILHYHLQNDASRLEAHFSFRIPNATRYYFFRRRPESNGVLRIWMAGYLYEDRMWPVKE